MTDQMDALPETEAIRMLSMFIDTAVGTMVTMHTTRIKEVRAELIRLAEENARLRPMLTARSQEMLRLVSESGELKTRAEKAEARVQELERENANRWKQYEAAVRNTHVMAARAERAESKLAAVEKRIAEAATGIAKRSLAPGCLVIEGFDDDPSDYHGERVALLPLDVKEPKQ